MYFNINSIKIKIRKIRIKKFLYLIKYNISYSVLMKNSLAIICIYYSSQIQLLSFVF